MSIKNLRLTENKKSQYWMLNDLVESEILLGKDKKQVIELFNNDKVIGVGKRK